MYADRVGPMGGAVAERSSGRVVMATRRIEERRQQAMKLLESAHAEVSRLIGALPAPPNGPSGQSAPKVSSETTELESQVDALDAVVAGIELLANRLREL